MIQLERRATFLLVNVLVNTILFFQQLKSFVFDLFHLKQQDSK